MAIVTCQVCGNPFEAKRSDAKYCKAVECQRQAHRNQAAAPEQRERHRAASRAYMRQRRAEDPDRYRDEYRQWYERRGVEYHKQWRDTHPEYRRSVVQRQRQREKDSPGLKQQTDARYYQRHKERIKANVVAWQEANHNFVLLSRQARNGRRRSREAQATGNWTPEQFRELCEAVDWHCAYCHGRFDKLTPDHITPLARGGDNDITNIVPACGSCNYSKQDKTPLEFLTRFPRVRRT